jgi:SAM-dependent methyltransferase
VHLVLGGFHLGHHRPEQLRAVIAEFRRLGVERVAPCHCTGELAIEMFAAEYGESFIVRADAERLPFRGGSFDAVTCSHAFYELKGEGAERALREVRRTLRPRGAFLMMEHEVPQKPLIRLLFYIRLLAMGLRKAREVLGNEEALFGRHFDVVERVCTETGRSKIIIGRAADKARC